MWPPIPARTIREQANWIRDVWVIRCKLLCCGNGAVWCRQAVPGTSQFFGGKGFKAVLSINHAGSLLRCFGAWVLALKL